MGPFGFDKRDAASGAAGRGGADGARRLLAHASSLAKSGKHKDAISAYSAILRQDSGNTGALYSKGMALNAIKKYSDAVTCFDAVLAIKPDDVRALNNRGIAMAEMGNI